MTSYLLSKHCSHIYSHTPAEQQQKNCGDAIWKQCVRNKKMRAKCVAHLSIKYAIYYFDLFLIKFDLWHLSLSLSLSLALRLSSFRFAHYFRFKKNQLPNPYCSIMSFDICRILSFYFLGWFLLFCLLYL